MKHRSRYPRTRRSCCWTSLSRRMSKPSPRVCRTRPLPRVRQTPRESACSSRRSRTRSCHGLSIPIAKDSAIGDGFGVPAGLACTGLGRRSAHHQLHVVAAAIAERDSPPSHTGSTRVDFGIAGVAALTVTATTTSWSRNCDPRTPPTRGADSVLRGTVKDPRNGRRRPYVRFFACGEDLSHEQPDAPLPAAVAAGAEPFRIVGAMPAAYLRVRTAAPLRRRPARIHFGHTAGDQSIRLADSRGVPTRSGLGSCASTILAS